jgi:hypothetical protein
MNSRGSFHWCKAIAGLKLTAYAYQPPALRMSGVDASNAPYTLMKCTMTDLHLHTEEKKTTHSEMNSSKQSQNLIGDKNQQN